MSRERHLQTYFGISEADYKSLLRKQRGKCYICEKHHTYFNTNLAVDHNHKTGEIRGLLCYRCNRYIVGNYTSLDIPVLQRLIRYLKKSTGWYVPQNRPKKRKYRKRKK